MKLEARGKRVIVTAGAGGIGRVVAGRFADLGARVWVNDIDAAAIAALPVGIRGTVCDVSDEAGMDAFMARALADLGDLDVLVNNAGIAGPTGPVEELSLADWRRTMAVNLDGMFLATRRAVPALKAAGGGAIVNMSSVAGRLGYPLRSPYSTSKFGVVGFTETLAMELGPFGISVNAILPGVVDGDRIRRVLSAKAEAQGTTPEAVEQQFLRNVSMRTKVQPDEIADMVLFLTCGPGRHVSGQSIGICGNFETLS